MYIIPKKIEEIDKNFLLEKHEEKGVSFKSCFEKPFSLHGFYKPYETEKLTRLPDSIKGGEDALMRLKELSECSAGGRLRFKTDSEIISVRAVLKNPGVLPHMASTGVMGFDLYSRPCGSRLPLEYTACFVPQLKDDKKSFEGSHRFRNSVMRDVSIGFPLYCGVSSLEIGIAENARLEEADPYTFEKPVVFYGSSITQGACSSRPGNCYNAILSRELDFDYINLGFSGNAYGDKCIANYISGLPMSVFVLDYDYNARSLKELSETHYDFYMTVRKNNPFLPVIMLSAPLKAPTRLMTPEKPMDISRVVIMESYIKGFRNGDRNLYFIDGESLLGTKNAQDCLVDSVHPSDVGFRNMADRIYPVLKDALYNGKSSV